MMTRRTIASAVMTCALFIVSLGCSYAQMATPNTSEATNSPDKVLFERAIEAMKNSKHAVARAQLETLIESYPDSDYVPRAKLSSGDAWYAEGSFKQAELEYRDFVTFFPSRPEVTQAQLRIDSMHKN
jgi:outer membrane protein assembly factor BamD